MLRLAVLASCLLGPACRYSLEDPAPAPDAALSASCMAATQRSDLAFIEDRIFKQSCIFSGCHNGNVANEAGMLDLRSGMSHAHLLNVDSRLDPMLKLVVPGQPNQSFLLMMMRHIAPADMSPPTVDPPADVGYMPQNAGGASLCVEKRDAIQRWIEAGALNN